MTLKIFVAISLLAVATAGCSNFGSFEEPIVFKQIALTGEVGRGITDGTKFQGFDVPAINGIGEVAFGAKFRKDHHGHTSEAIFGPTGDGGSPGLICRNGEPAIGAADGALFNGFVFVTLNNKGDLAFKGLLLGSDGEKLTLDNDQAIFGPTAGSGSPLGMLMRRGDAVPAGFHKDDVEINTVGPPLLNNKGQIAFGSNLRKTEKTRFRSNDGIVCGPVADTATPFGMIAFTGGAIDGDKITSLSRPEITDDGRIAFFMSTETGMAIAGPALGGGRQLSLLAKEGNEAPGAKDKALYNFKKMQPRHVSLNNQGDVAYVAGLRTGQGTEVTEENDMAIFGPTAGTGSATGLLFREGDPAIGVADGTLINSLGGHPQLNDGGDIAFHCALRINTGDVVSNKNDEAIYGPLQAAGSPVGLIARDGDVAPGVKDGAVFNLRYLYGPVINNRGNLAFRTALSAGDGREELDKSNSVALFAYVDGKLRMVARTGEAFEVTPNSGPVESRTISQIHFTQAQANNKIFKQYISDENTIVFGLEFTDGTSGIFTAAFPVEKD